MKLRVLTLVLVACNAPSKCPPSHEPKILHGDLLFTPDERAQIEGALAAWDAFSDHRVWYTVKWDGDLRGETVTRIDAWDPRLAEREARLNAHKQVLGWQFDQRLYLVPSRIVGDRLRLVMQHELGHQIGLRWGTDVHHPNPTSLMSAEFSDHDFGPDDKAMCQASGICP